MKKILLILITLLSVNAFSQCTLPAISPYSEDFNSGVLPTCWSQGVTSGSGWVFTGTPGYSTGSNGRNAGTYAWIDFSGTDVDPALRLENVDVSGLTVPSILFDYYSDLGTYTCSPANIMHVEAFDGTTWNNVATLQLNVAGWNTYYYSLSGHDVAGVIMVRFRGESSGQSCDYYNDLLIDDVQIMESPPLGCADPFALNYDSTAIVDDGSCTYLSGCTNSLAYNYDSTAVVDDGSCISIIYGCMDSTALNYYAAANVNGSCTYCYDTSYTNITSCDSLVWNGTTYTQSGTYSYGGPSNNYSLDFDGQNDYIDLGDILNNLYPTITLQASFYIEDNGGIILATDNGFPSYYNGYWIDVDTSVISITYGDGGWHGGGERRTGKALVSLVPHTWYNLTTIARGPNDFSIYLDGVSLVMNYNDAGHGGTVNFTSDPFKIGSIHTSSYNPRYFSGKLDEIRVWDLELSSQDIVNYINCPPTGYESGLVGYWNFEEGGGSIVYDQTLNGNHGTINGATYDANVPSQSCGGSLTNINGCDSTAILNLTLDICGCTNSLSCNYDSLATVDDGSCAYPTSSTTTLTSCDSLTWNGTTYTQSGTYYANTSSNNNYSMSFDGNDDEIIVTSSPAFSSNFTIQAWWYKAIGSTNNAFWTIGDSYLPDGLELYVGGGGTETKVYSGGGPVILANSNPSPGEWHHYAVVRESGVVKLYIDGVQDPNTWNSNTTFNGDLTIGQEIYSGGSLPMWCDGDIDNFEIWDISLSQQEIQNYMNCPPTGTEAGLVGYWNFEQGSGTTVHDQTSNGNNGTINGAVYDTNVPYQYCNLTNSNGCDSTAILNLTINQGDTSYTNITACDSLVWNGTTYTQSGTYSYSGSSVNNNYSMSFDGTDDYIDINDISVNNNFTFSAYVYAKDPTTTDVFNILSTDLPQNVPSSNLLQWGCFDHNLKFGLWAGSSNNSCFSINSINRFEWTHVSVTYDGSNARFYINGSLDNIETISITPSYPISIIGRYLSGSNVNMDGKEPWNGFMDNIEIWNTALTQQEIQNYMICPPIGNEAGLLGYWGFETGNGTTAYDQTSNGNDGILVNGSTWDTNVPTQSCNLINTNGCDSTAILNLTINQADTSYTNITACDSAIWNGTTYTQSGTYSYGGSSSSNNYSVEFVAGNNNEYIDCGNGLISGNEFSFMSWIKLNSIPSQVGNVFRQHPNNGHWLRFLPNSTKIDFKLSPMEISSTTSLNINQWYHVTAIYDGANMKIYIDGSLDTDVSVSTGFTNYNEPFVLGACAPIYCNGGEFFDGNIDNTSVWLKALTQQEILGYMNCPPTGNESGIEGSWSFEEGSGTTAFDQTPNGNDGIINGAAYNTDIPVQSCNLTNINGCDSTAILNLTINQGDTSYTNITACDSVVWNGTTYTQSGTYSTNVGSNNNYSMSFDGIDDYLQIANLPSYSGMNELTVQFYIKWDYYPYQTYGKGVGIVRKNGSYEFYTHHDADQLTFMINTQYNQLGVDIPISNNMNLNTWYLISGVYDGQNSFLYIDGQLINQTSLNGQVLSGISPLVLALDINNNGNTMFFGGSVDGAQIWNKSLSQQEIQNYMNCPPMGNESGLVGYWNFEEGSGSTALDISGNGNNGTINGATYNNNTPTQSCNLTNANGCDSVSVLNLTINQGDTSYTNITACDSIVWNGTTYNQSGTYSYSGNYNSGVNNYSMSFDGNSSYVQILNNFNTSNQQGVSFQFWAKSDWNQTPTGAQNEEMMINFGNIQGVNPEYRYTLSRSGSKLDARCEGTGFSSGGQAEIDVSNLNLINNEWINIAGVYKINGVVDLYINGVNVNSGTFTLSGNNIGLTHGVKYIGNNGLPANRELIGHMDNVAFWNKPLTEQEINQYINCPPTGNETGLVGYWNFEQGSGTTAYDLTSNGNNGTINGATYNTNVPAQSCTLTNSNGCDSTAILNLIINQVDTSYTNITACDSYTWNDSTYTQSGTYYDNTSSNNNYSIRLDGVDDYIDIDLTQYAEFTYMGWFNINNFHPDATTIYQHKNTCVRGAGHALGVEPVNEKLRWIANDCGTCSSNSCNWPNYINNYYNQITAGEWYFVSLVSNGVDKQIIYLNGIAIDSVLNSNTFATYGVQPLFIGKWLDGSTGPFFSDGLFDNFSYWNIALSEQEIQNYMHCPPIGEETGLIGYWNFEEGSGNTAYDQTSNGNDGTINGATYDSNVPAQSCALTNANGCDSTAVLNLTINHADTSYTSITACDSIVWNGTTYTQSGTYSYGSGGASNNYSMSFDGNDYIDLGTDTILGSFNQLSFMTWIKPHNITPPGGQYPFSIGLNQHWLEVYNGKARFGINGNVLDSYDPLVQNNWTHIVCVYDGVMMKIYINGLLNQSTPLVGVFDDFGLFKYIGKGGNHFDGEMGQFSLWNTALSQQEIQQYMNCSLTGNEAGLVGYWDFEEGSGTTAYDQTANGNNGTINGATYNTNVPTQSCPLTNANGCDSTAILNLTINQGDTSYTNITACDSVVWNGNTYTQSGTYSSSNGSNNNYSMSFDGVDDYVEIINNNTFILSDFSMSFLIKTTDLAAHLIAKDANPEPPGGDWGIGMWNGFITVNVRKVGSGYAVLNEENYPINDDEWHSVIVTRNSGSGLVQLWIDGLMDQQGYGPLGDIYNNMDINLGRHNSTGTDHFDGFMDNVHIWDIILDSIQIQNFMNCTPTGTESGLVGYWNLEEGTGTIAYDQTSNGNNGTLVNGATYDANVPSQSCGGSLTNINGCDSTAILNLTINQRDTSYTNITACDSIVWNGTTYNQSGTYSYGSGGASNNYSMSFDNVDDYVDVGVDIAGTDFTLMLWAKTDSAACNAGTFISEKGPPTISNMLHFGHSSCNAQCPSCVYLDFYETNPNPGLYTTAPLSNEWTFWSATYNTNTLRRQIFRNGILLIDTVMINPYNGNNDLLLGAEYNWIATDFEGNMDDVSIWNKVLTQQEIQQYMTCPPSTNDAGLVVYYNFEEGSGSTALDLSGNGNNGTIYGNAIYSTNVPSQSCNLTNANGCDSTAILNLTINQADTSYTNITACDSVVWNGNTYTQSGTYSSSNGSNNNYSMSFDGVDDYIDYGDVFNNLTLPVTFSFDISIVDSSTTNVFCTDSDFDLGTNNYFGFWLSVSPSLIECSYGDGGFAGGHRRTGRSYVNLSLNSWYNINVTINGPGDFQIFIDAQPQLMNYTDGGHGGSVSHNSYPYTFGGSNIGNNSNSFYAGNFDNIQIWSTILTQSEIQQYMNCPPTGTESDLVGYWNFEEGSGNTVLDQTSNGNNGSINGANYDSNVPSQSCGGSLTNINGCDSTAMLNLTILECGCTDSLAQNYNPLAIIDDSSCLYCPNDTSYTNITACDSVVWNGTTYDSSGTYSYGIGGASNNYSLSSVGGNNKDMQVPYTSSFHPANAFSFTCHIKASTATSTTLMHTGSDGDPENTFTLQCSYNIFPNYYVFDLRAEYGGGSDFTYTSTPFILNNDWNFITATWDGISWRFYINGQLISSTIAPSAPGSWAGRDFSFIDGEPMFDNLQIWNSVLSQQEIQQYMNCPPTGNETGLAGYWNFEEGSGNTALDLSGNGNNGTINGATYDANVPSQSCVGGLTNANGCDSTAILNLTISDLSGVISISSQVSCFGFCDGVLSVNASQGHPPYTYSIGGGPFQSSPTFTGLCGNTTYSITVKDANGCIFNANKFLPEPTQISFSDSLSDHNGFNISCFGCTDGSIHFQNPSGGVPPYTYSIDGVTFSTTMNFTGLSAGIYTLIVMDGNACISVGPNVTLTEPSFIPGCTDSTALNYNPLAHVNDSSCIPYIYGCMDSLAINYDTTANTDDGSCTYCNFLSMTLSQSPVTCSGWNDGTVSANVSGGTPPYNYSWSTGDTTSQIDNLTQGMYILTISDGICSLSDSITIQLGAAPADSMHPEICYVSVDNTGFNRVVLKPLANPLTTSYVVLREYAANLYTPLDTLDANTLEYVDSTSNPGVQAERYKVSAIDACGNGTDTSSYHKTVHLTMNAGINGWVNLMWNDYEGYQVLSYLIYRGNSVSNMTQIGYISGTNTSWTDQSPPAGYLMYQIRAFAQNCNPVPNAFMLPDTLESNIIDHNNVPLNVTIASGNPLCDTCNNGWAIANASGGTPPYTYVWINSGTQGSFISGLSSGTYTVIAFDGTGNQSTASVTLTSPIYGCTDSTMFNYNPLANINDGSCIPFVYGCMDSIAVNYNSTANVDDGSCIFCDISLTLYPTQNSSNTACNGVIFTIANSSNGPITYLWSNGSIQNNAVTLCSGTYKLTVTDAVGCWVSDSVVIGSPVIYGCTDPTATNYDPNANTDDGSCTYSCGGITGVYMSEVIHDRARFNWDNMNTAYCDVDQIRFRYREVGTNSWSTKTMGVPVGSGCNTSNTSKLVLGLTPSTTYEYDFKIWYCNASTVTWHANGSFTTLPLCDNVINIIPTPITTTKTTFCWDTVSTYAFVRLKYREDVPGSSFSNIGGMGVHSPTLCKDKNGLTPGTDYRVMWRTWCSPNGGPYRSSQWDGPVLWTQPNSIRIEDGTSINNLEVYPNPSRDVFNVSFTSETKQSIEVRVVNLIGEVIFTENLEDFDGEYTHSFNLSEYSKGIYLLELDTDNGIVNKKLILQ